MLYVSLLLFTAIAAIVVCTSRFRLNVFFVLLGVAVLTGLAGGLSADQTLTALKSGMGSTVEKIGLLIILGITLGTLLEKSGATTKLAVVVLSRTGHQRAPAAMSGIGFLIGLPIFCDAGFVVLSGLLSSLLVQIPGKRIALTVSLATALYAVHCLVPPHPGITAAAGAVQADVGLVMLLGVLAAIPPALTGYLMASYFNNKYVLPDLSDEPAKEPNQPELPSLLFSVLPIVVPVLLIAVKSVLQMVDGYAEATWWPVVAVLGEPTMALFAGIVLCLPLMKKGKSESGMYGRVLDKAGSILLLTAAGGAFGSVIQALEPGEIFGPALSASGLGLLVPFILAAVLKTAQGSSTVAVISTAGMLAPLMQSLGFATPADTVLAVLAMGAGSMAVSHTNDSYFWVVSRFSGLP
ncbi:MAG: GntP family permease, partial [Saprospiraceae bacterium]|nr:GntP family permease [Saprospiraceae bacterium]